jgi:hypothetical protein
MAHKELLVALSLIAASPVSATSPEPIPAEPPAGTAETQYCMHVEPTTGSRLETVRCWTRAQWAELGVDVEKDWAKEGVAVIG